MQRLCFTDACLGKIREGKVKPETCRFSRFKSLLNSNVNLFLNFSLGYYDSVYFLVGRGEGDASMQCKTSRDSDMI